ncbi:MATE family efflux transporter [Alkaliphilus peptidifermentans]|uniref:Probable multidrug resistance protein NorM n=1 Tax=Alkaliphilus peptidifermentans DSM 18978 TaxID=1120976 RepID=A0A1G5KBK1_9FIRM|nr:MATE family efflux transporter [Alkaliphilus peptidifermentans]SCY97420.1 putative efflux protein, MATE family [Alkaliphilus peptidifermentans DSM 18978]
MIVTNYLAKTNQKQIKRIWALAWPVMVGQFLHTMMVMADMWFIARLGSLEAAAAGTSTSVIGVIQVLPFLIATGVIALVSRFSGAKDEENIKSITINGMILSILVGFMVTFLFYYSINDVLKIFGEVNEGVMAQAKVYLGIALFGIPFFFYNATSKAIIQATGDTKNPVKIFILMNVTNILLDYIFIMVLKRGIGGAALATVISEVLGFTLMSLLVFKNIFGNRIRTFIDAMQFKFNTSLRILKIGLYSVLQMITRPLTGLVMYRIVLAQGVAAGAAFGIGGRLFNFVFIFLAGLGTAMSVLVGHNLGQKDTAGADEIVKQGMRLALLNMLVFSIPFFVFPEYLMRAFVDDVEVIKVGVEYLRICYLGVIFVIFPFVFGSAFTGAGDTFPPMLASILGNWGVKIPIAYILTNMYSLGTNGVWIAISLSVVVEALVMIVWFYRGKWKEKSI